MVLLVLFLLHYILAKKNIGPFRVLELDVNRDREYHQHVVPVQPAAMILTENNNLPSSDHVTPNKTNSSTQEPQLSATAASFTTPAPALPPALPPTPAMNPLDVVIKINGAAQFARFKQTMARFFLFHPNKYARAAIALFLYSYNTLCTTIFNYLDCVEVEPGVKVVRTFPAVFCNSSDYTQYM